jgi:hypothetical protein
MPNLLKTNLSKETTAKNKPSQKDPPTNSLAMPQTHQPTLNPPETSSNLKPLPNKTKKPLNKHPNTQKTPFSPKTSITSPSMD